MERGEKLKFVYEDNKITKVLKGYILKEDEFSYTVKAEITNQTIVLGKRSIVKVCGVY